MVRMFPRYLGAFAIMVLVAMIAVLAMVVVALALGLARGAWMLAGDRRSPIGNRLYRLHQRLDDAGGRLGAAVQITMEGLW